MFKIVYQLVIIFLKVDLSDSFGLSTIHLKKFSCYIIIRVEQRYIQLKDVFYFTTMVENGQRKKKS